MLKLAEKINLDPYLTEKVKVLYEKKGEKINRCADRCISTSFGCLKGKDGIFTLAVMLCLAVRVKEKYDEYGIDEKIYYDTMSDIKIWSEKTQGKGLKEYGWIKNHVSFELFRLGRLQFQLYECKNRTLFYNKLPFSFGEKLIYVHIPEGEKLEKDKCEESLATAGAFFRSFFPDYEYRYYFCESWLLYEGNRDFMAENSNIVKFMSLFDICYSIKIDAQAIERIYGKRKLFKKNYSERTSLQKSAKEYMLSGNTLGVGVGVIALSVSEFKINRLLVHS